MTAASNPRGSRSSLFNGGLPSEQDLPTGSCNYRDLSIGSRAPLCGCQRFYLNGSQHGASGTPDRAWCFCGHHACFHNAFSQQRAHEPTSLSSPRPVALPEQEQVLWENGATASAVRQAGESFAKVPAGLGIQAGGRSNSHSINTRVWQALNDFARNQEDGGASITTSKLPSTAAPSVVDEPPIGPSHDAHGQLQTHRSMGPPVNIPQQILPKPNDDCSATEVATPSVAGTPDFRAFAHSHQARTSPERVKQDRRNPALTDAQGDRLPEDVRPTVHEAASLQDLHNMIRTYSQRLEALESLSFSQIPYEEMQDRFDLFDGRILDLENWRIEQNQHTSDPDVGQASRNTHRRLLPDETASFTSDASFDRNAAIHTEAAVLATLAANAETHPRIDALENRIADLEDAALPSYARPWQVQVVLLPWSRELRGVWFSSHEATQHSLRSATQTSEEWTATQAGTASSFQSSVNGAWTTQSIEAWANEAHTWLSPKACGPSGAVFQRLKSRGLVKDVTLTASDARHIMQTISAALRGPFSLRQELASEHIDAYQGLHESFVPLRKVRKSSRLRFLNPSEMSTSAVWTAGFLDSSVFMKTSNGQRRLYITTPDAYIQPVDSPASTWEDIRNLPRRSGDDEEEQFAQHSATEDYWTYHEHLDQPISVHSSFGASQWSTRSQMTNADPQMKAQSPLSPWSESHVVHQRTVSLPNSATTSAQMQAIVPQRRIASFGASMKHQHEEECGVEIIAKRRRISLSPEAERRGVNFTPRWSREPPSPYTSEAAVETKSQGAGSRKRGNTPFAYATPHSNSNYVGRMDLVPEDGDTEVDTDAPWPSSDHHGEEEWEGVKDEHMHENGAESEVGSSADDVSIAGADVD